MRAILRALDRFWFASVSPLSLGLLRIALVGYLVALRLPEEVGLLLYRNSWPREFMVPGLWLRLSPLPFPFPIEHLALFHTVMVLAGTSAALGLCTRPALFVFTIGYVYLKGVESAWGSFDHEPAIVVQILALLVVAPGATACSIDGVIRWLRQRERRPANIAAVVVGSPVPRWGTQLILITLILGYCGAGIAKVRHGGLKWLDGKTLGFYMTGHSQSSRIQQMGSATHVPVERRWKDGFGLEFYLLGAQSSWLSEVMARHERTFMLAATGALCFELLSPLMLLGGPYRTALLLGAASMHLFIAQVMNIKFVSWIVIDVALVDWQWLLAARAWRRPRDIVEAWRARSRAHATAERTSRRPAADAPQSVYLSGRSAGDGDSPASRDGSRDGAASAADRQRVGSRSAHARTRAAVGSDKQGSTPDRW